MCRIVPAKGRHTRERHVHLMRHRDEACVCEVGVGEGSSRAAVVERAEEGVKQTCDPGCSVTGGIAPTT